MIQLNAGRIYCQPFTSLPRRQHCFREWCTRWKSLTHPHLYGGWIHLMWSLVYCSCWDSFGNTNRFEIARRSRVKKDFHVNKGFYCILVASYLRHNKILHLSWEMSKGCTWADDAGLSEKGSAADRKYGCRYFDWENTAAKNSSWTFFLEKGLDTKYTAHSL